MTEAFYITPETRDQYIAEALSFCDNVTSRFVRQAHLSRWYDDLHGIARLKLVDIVDKLAKSGKPLANKTHFFAKVRISLRRRLIDASEEFHIIKAPRTRGKDSEGVPRAWLTGCPDMGAAQNVRAPAPNRFCRRKWSYVEEYTRKPVTPATKNELLDRCVDGIDRAILTQGLNGQTRKEIAHDLGITQREVRQRAKRLLTAGPVE